MSCGCDQAMLSSIIGSMRATWRTQRTLTPKDVYVASSSIYLAFTKWLGWNVVVAEARLRNNSNRNRIAAEAATAVSESAF
jgi:hypothetical protein